MCLAILMFLKFLKFIKSNASKCVKINSKKIRKGSMYEKIKKK